MPRLAAFLAVLVTLGFVSPLNAGWIGITIILFKIFSACVFIS